MLSQAEADALFEMQKYQADSAEYRFPPIGGKCAVPLVSADRRERFVLDIRKKSMEIAKGTFQSRQQSVILARLDFGGRPHRNPDDEEIASPHLHLYREGFGDRWAFPLPAAFSDASDDWGLFENFLLYCNIDKIKAKRLQ